MKSLKFFILQGQSRLLYREFIKKTSLIKQKELREEIVNQIRSQFKSKKNVEDEKKIKFLIMDGKSRLTELESYLNFTL